jgi:hypothetical protein
MCLQEISRPSTEAQAELARDESMVAAVFPKYSGGGCGWGCMGGLVETHEHVSPRLWLPRNSIIRPRLYMSVHLSGALSREASSQIHYARS